MKHRGRVVAQVPAELELAAVIGQMAARQMHVRALDRHRLSSDRNASNVLLRRAPRARSSSAFTVECW